MQWFNALRCPFEITLETTNTVPAEFRGDAYHFTIGQDGIPFTAYFINYKGARLAVSNYYGVWFEVQKRDTIFEAKRVARDELHLPELPMFGMDIVALKVSGTPPTRAPSRAPSRAEEAPPEQASEHKTEPERDTNMAIASSQTTRARPPFPPRRGPRGTGDDPYTLGYLKEEQPKRGACLEGQAPQIYNGDRSKTMDFLTEFKRFMLMNSGATIARDPICRSVYFLSLLRGPHVDGWKMRQYEWLDRVDSDPRDLPFGMSTWQVLE